MVNYKINTIKNGIVTKTEHHKFPQGKVSLCPYVTEINVDHENETVKFEYDFQEQNVFNVVQNYIDPDTQEVHHINRLFNQPPDRTTYEIPNTTPTSTIVHGRTQVLPPEGVDLSGIPVGCQIKYNDKAISMGMENVKLAENEAFRLIKSQTAMKYNAYVNLHGVPPTMSDIDIGLRSIEPNDLNKQHIPDHSIAHLAHLSVHDLFLKYHIEENHPNFEKINELKRKMIELNNEFFSVACTMPNVPGEVRDYQGNPTIPDAPFPRHPFTNYTVDDERIYTFESIRNRAESLNYIAPKPPPVKFGDFHNTTHMVQGIPIATSDQNESQEQALVSLFQHSINHNDPSSGNLQNPRINTPEAHALLNTINENNPFGDDSPAELISRNGQPVNTNMSVPPGPENINQMTSNSAPGTPQFPIIPMEHDGTNENGTIDGKENSRNQTTSVQNEIQNSPNQNAFNQMDIDPQEQKQGPISMEVDEKKTEQQPKPIRTPTPPPGLTRLWCNACQVVGHTEMDTCNVLRTSQSGRQIDPVFDSDSDDHMGQQNPHPTTNEPKSSDQPIQTSHPTENEPKTGEQTTPKSNPPPDKKERKSVEPTYRWNKNLAEKDKEFLDRYSEIFEGKKKIDLKLHGIREEHFEFLDKWSAFVVRLPLTKVLYLMAREKIRQQSKFVLTDHFKIGNLSTIREWYICMKARRKELPPDKSRILTESDKRVGWSQYFSECKEEECARFAHEYRLQYAEGEIMNKLTDFMVNEYEQYLTEKKDTKAEDKISIIPYAEHTYMDEVETFVTYSRSNAKVKTNMDNVNKFLNIIKNNYEYRDGDNLTCKDYKKLKEKDQTSTELNDLLEVATMFVSFSQQIYGPVAVDECVELYTDKDKNYISEQTANVARKDLILKSAGRKYISYLPQYKFCIFSKRNDAIKGTVMTNANMNLYDCKLAYQVQQNPRTVNKSAYEEGKDIIKSKSPRPSIKPENTPASSQQVPGSPTPINNSFTSIPENQNVQSPSNQIIQPESNLKSNDPSTTNQIVQPESNPNSNVPSTSNQIAQQVSNTNQLVSPPPENKTVQPGVNTSQIGTPSRLNEIVQIDNQNGVPTNVHTSNMATGDLNENQAALDGSPVSRHSSSGHSNLSPAGIKSSSGESEAESETELDVYTRTAPETTEITGEIQAFKAILKPMQEHCRAYIHTDYDVHRRKERIHDMCRNSIDKSIPLAYSKSELASKYKTYYAKQIRISTNTIHNMTTLTAQDLLADISILTTMVHNSDAKNFSHCKQSVVDEVIKIINNLRTAVVKTHNDEHKRIEYSYVRTLIIEHLVLCLLEDTAPPKENKNKNKKRNLEVPDQDDGNISMTSQRSPSEIPENNNNENPNNPDPKRPRNAGPHESVIFQIKNSDTDNEPAIPVPTLPPSRPSTTTSDTTPKIKSDVKSELAIHETAMSQDDQNHGEATHQNDIQNHEEAAQQNDKQNHDENAHQTGKQNHGEATHQNDIQNHEEAAQQNDKQNHDESAQQSVSQNQQNGQKDRGSIGIQLPNDAFTNTHSGHHLENPYKDVKLLTGVFSSDGSNKESKPPRRESIRSTTRKSPTRGDLNRSDKGKGKKRNRDKNSSSKGYQSDGNDENGKGNRNGQKSWVKKNPTGSDPGQGRRPSFLGLTSGHNPRAKGASGHDDGKGKSGKGKSDQDHDKGKSGKDYNNKGKPDQDHDKGKSGKEYEHKGKYGKEHDDKGKYGKEYDDKGKSGKYHHDKGKSDQEHDEKGKPMKGKGKPDDGKNGKGKPTDILNDKQTRRTRDLVKRLGLNNPDCQAALRFERHYQANKHTFYPELGTTQCDDMDCFTTRDTRREDGSKNFIYPLKDHLPKHENYGWNYDPNYDTKLTQNDTTYLSNLDWNVPSVNSHGLYDPSKIKAYKINKDTTDEVSLHLSVPNIDAMNRAFLIIYYPGSGGFSLLDDLNYAVRGLKRKINEDIDINYILSNHFVLSIGWSCANSAKKWGKSLPMKIHKALIWESYHYQYDVRRRIILGQSRGSYAGFDHILFDPKSANTFILTAPYFCKAPSLTAQDSMMLVDPYRIDILLERINENPDLTIVLAVGDEDEYLNTSITIGTVLRGNHKNNTLFLYDGGGHSASQILTLHRENTSRLRLIISKIKQNLGEINDGH